MGPSATSKGLESTALTARAFTAGLGPIGGKIVLVASLMFGFTTLITWAFYGEQCAVFLALLALAGEVLHRRTQDP